YGPDRASIPDADARAPAQALQHLLEREPPDRREPVAVDVDALVAVHDALHRPALHRGLEEARQFGLVPLEEGERSVGEDHAETVGRTFGILLEGLHVPRREAALHEQREQQARRSRPDYGDAHAMTVSYFTVRTTSPYDRVIFHEPGPRGLVQVIHRA